MAQKGSLIDNWPDDLLKVVGEITIASGQLEYALELSIKRAAGKPFSQGMQEAANLQDFKAKRRELKRHFADGDHPDKENAELAQILDDAYRIYQQRHTVIHGLFALNEDGAPVPLAKDKTRGVSYKGVNYGIEMLELTSLRDDLRSGRNRLLGFTKRLLN